VSTSQDESNENDNDLSNRKAVLLQGQTCLCKYRLSTLLEMSVFSQAASLLRPWQPVCDALAAIEVSVGLLFFYRPVPLLLLPLLLLLQLHPSTKSVGDVSADRPLKGHQSLYQGLWRLGRWMETSKNKALTSSSGSSPGTDRHFTKRSVCRIFFSPVNFGLRNYRCRCIWSRYVDYCVIVL
jgi:hypothetical protein